MKLELLEIKYEDLVEDDDKFYLIWDGSYFASCVWWPCMKDTEYGEFFDGDTFYTHDRIFQLPSSLPK